MGFNRDMSRVEARVSVLVVGALVLAGCATGAQSEKTAAPRAEPAADPPRGRSRQSDSEAESSAAGPVEAPAARPASEPSEAEVLPADVDGGEIPRPALFAVLQEGVGHFLRRVEVEPHLAGGRFVGWRVMRIFERDSELRSNVIKAGDVILRINGQSIERPEQFKNVWDSLSTSGELVLLVRRGGKDSTVRYRIVE